MISKVYIIIPLHLIKEGARMTKLKTSVFFMGFFILLVFGLSIFFFVRGNQEPSISGSFIDDFGSLPFEMNLSLIAFVGQWVLLLLIVFIGYLRFLKHRREEEAKIRTFVIPQNLPKPQTNIDVFYSLIKEQKALSLTIISKLFKINKEKALEWARILEDKELVTIEYPAFSDPEVRIKGYKEVEKESEQPSVKTTETQDNKIQEVKDGDKQQKPSRMG